MSSFQRRFLVFLTVVFTLVLAMLWLWNNSTIGCGPELLPSWLPIAIQRIMEIRCHS